MKIKPPADKRNEVLQLIANAMNKHLVPAIQKQPKPAKTKGA